MGTQRLQAGEDRSLDKNVGFVGDSLNENFLVLFLCVLRVADDGAKKWKKKGAWRGAYFPKFNVTVAYHRAVLLAKTSGRDASCLLSAWGTDKSSAGITGWLSSRSGKYGPVDSKGSS
ncbi:hypothetical protein V6N13_005381 [Hibiscus sabdariffa]